MLYLNSNSWNLKYFFHYFDCVTRRLLTVISRQSFAWHDTQKLFSWFAIIPPDKLSTTHVIEKRTCGYFTLNSCFIKSCYPLWMIRNFSISPKFRLKLFSLERLKEKTAKLSSWKSPWRTVRCLVPGVVCKFLTGRIKHSWDFFFHSLAFFNSYLFSYLLFLLGDWYNRIIETYS